MRKNNKKNILKLIIFILFGLSIFINYKFINKVGYEPIYTEFKPKIDTVFIDSTTGKNYNNNIDLKLDSILDILKKEKNINEDKDVTLSELYMRINNDIYPDKKLPIINIYYANLENDGAAGMYINNNGKRQIQIDYNMQNNTDLPDIIAHEMIHYYLDYKGITDDHNEPFKKEMRRINNLGKNYNVSIYYHQ